MTKITDSFWRDSKWSNIYASVKATLSPKDFKAWLLRPDVIARSKVEPQ